MAASITALKIKRKRSVEFLPSDRIVEGDRSIPSGRRSRRDPGGEWRRP